MPTSNRNTGKAILLILISSCCFGSLTTLTLFTERTGLPLLPAMFWRYALATGMLFVLFRRRVLDEIKSLHAWRLMLLGGLVLGISLMLLSVVSGFGQALAVMLLVGAGSSAFQMLNNALVMQECDRAFYGRVMSITMLAWGFNGLAGYPFGALADASGERTTLLLMGTIVVSATVVTALLSVALSRRTPTPSRRVATVGSSE